jgi:hypothetical protein
MADFPSGPSEKQIAFIGRLQQSMKLTDAQLADIVKEVTNCDSVMEMGRGDASTLIDHLLGQAKASGVDTQAGSVATEKQVKFMRSLKKKAKLDDAAFEAFLLENAKVKTPEEVGKRDASVVIDKLIGMTGGTPRPASGGAGGPPSRGGPPARGRSRGGAAGPPSSGGAAPDERPPDRPGDGPPAEDEDIPF